MTQHDVQLLTYGATFGALLMVLVHLIAEDRADRKRIKARKQNETTS